MSTTSKDSMKAALMEFCDTIEATGGLIRYGDGSVGCAADPDWGDLARAYQRACHALGRKVRVKRSEYESAFLDPGARF